MSLVIKFYFTSSMLNMFRTLIHPSIGAYDYSVELPHWSCVLGSMCVGVSVWLGWSTANQERNDQCDDQHYSRELLMMGIVVPETF